jgi:pimeloyl-ACP methyl ester carboxylesterase
MTDSVFQLGSVRTVVLFFPGISVPSTCFELLASHFHERAGMSTLTFNYPGRGGAPGGSQTIERYTHDADLLLHRHRAHYDRVVLVGYSMGGLVLAHFLRRHPGWHQLVTRTILIAPAGLCRQTFADTIRAVPVVARVLDGLLPVLFDTRFPGAFVERGPHVLTAHTAYRRQYNSARAYASFGTVLRETLSSVAMFDPEVFAVLNQLEHDCEVFLGDQDATIDARETMRNGLAQLHRPRFYLVHAAGHNDLTMTPSVVDRIWNHVGQAHPRDVPSSASSLACSRVEQCGARV